LNEKHGAEGDDLLDLRSSTEYAARERSLKVLVDRFKGGRTEKAKEDHLNAFHAGCHYVVLKTLPKKRVDAY